MVKPVFSLVSVYFLATLITHCLPIADMKEDWQNVLEQAERIYVRPIDQS